MSLVGKRRKWRELAMQMLFQRDMGKKTPEEVRETFWEARDEVEDDTRGFAEDIFRVATAREAETDRLIVEHSANWKLARMAASTVTFCARRWPRWWDFRGRLRRL